MTRQEAEQILIHYDDLVWQRDNHITCGMINEALNLATDALNPWRKVSEELPKESGSYFVKYTIDSCSVLYDGICHYNECRWINVHLLGNGRISITHWMEIPELPKED